MTSSVSFTVLMVDRLSSFSFSSFSFLLLHASSSASDSDVLNDWAVWMEINPLSNRCLTACWIRALGVMSLVLGSNKREVSAHLFLASENPVYQQSFLDGLHWWAVNNTPSAAELVEHILHIWSLIRGTNETVAVAMLTNSVNDWNGFRNFLRVPPAAQSHLYVDTCQHC